MWPTTRCLTPSIASVVRSCLHMQCRSKGLASSRPKERFHITLSAFLRSSQAVNAVNSEYQQRQRLHIAPNCANIPKHHAFRTSLLTAFEIYELSQPTF